MSFQAMTWATEQNIPAMQKIVLLMMANRSNHDTGLCCPSHDLLARECGMSKRSLIEQIDKLEKAGLIDVIRSVNDKKMKSVNRYILHITKKVSNSGSESHSLGGSAGDALGSAGDALGGSAPNAHKPVNIEPVIEPKENIPETVVSAPLPEKKEEIKAPRKPPPPYQDIIDIYHEILKDLPGVYKLNDQRKRHIKSLWIDELDDLNQWRNYFKHIKTSNFLMGKVVNGNKSPFVCTFDFIINPNNFLKIAEDKYHERKKVRV